jgi:hypothetical protein
MTIKHIYTIHFETEELVKIYLVWEEMGRTLISYNFSSHSSLFGRQNLEERKIMKDEVKRYTPWPMG